MTKPARWARLNEQQKVHRPLWKQGQRGEIEEWLECPAVIAEEFRRG